MDFSPSSIFAGLLYGVIGFWAFKEGKKKANFGIIFTGIALMIYPYFVSGALASWGIGAALCGYLYYNWES